MVLTAEGGAPRWGADPSGQRRGGRSTARSLGQTQKFSGKFQTIHSKTIHSRENARSFSLFLISLLQRSFVFIRDIEFATRTIVLYAVRQTFDEE